MLVTFAECLRYLCCPGGGPKLSLLNEHTLGCDHQGLRREYPIINGVPVIVDFERSVLDEFQTKGSAATSWIRRRDYKGALGVAKRLVSPRKRSTANNISELIRRLRHRGGQTRLLVVGGGSVGQGTEPIYHARDIDVFSFDIYASPTVQFVADAHGIPLPSAFFDAVIVQAVLEHVLQPSEVVSEIWRVLKPAGLVYAETPFMQQVHEGPYDFTRFTESGHRYLFRRFDLVASGPSGGPGMQFLWSVDHLVRGIFRSRAAGQIAKLLFFWVQYADCLIPVEYSIDGASGFYFLGSKSETEMRPRDIIRYYNGEQKTCDTDRDRATA